MNQADYYVAGVDPGLAKFGYVLMRISISGPGIPIEVDLQTVEVIKTKPAKRKERRADEDLRARLKQITDFLYVEWETKPNKPRVLAMESLSFVRNASVSAKIALAHGATQALANASSIPIVCYSPQEIKLACGLKRDASKADVEAVIRGKWKSAKWPDHGEREHAFDAAGAVMAFLKDNSWVSFLI
jgi:Holliday junction resolvasome RuvABC endonuclease subunit